MKYFFSLLCLFSVALAGSLPSQYAALSDDKKQQYDLMALQVKPRLDEIDQVVRRLARTESVPAETRFEKLTTVQNQLNLWVGESVLKYTIMLPLLNSVEAQREALAKTMPLRVPYKNHQILAQFDVSGAQAYALGDGNVTLIRGKTQRGTFARNDRVMVYFKQGGPQLTKVREIVSNPGDTTEALLLDSDISLDRFLGGAALFIPQN